MDNLKIGIRVLGPRRVALAGALLPALLAGCAHAPEASVPKRAAGNGALVRLATDEHASRNDAILGANREPVVRIIDGSSTSTLDRQMILDGRPQTTFRVTTRSRSVSQH